MFATIKKFFSRPKPDPKTVEKQMDVDLYSPDAWKLELQEFQHLLVYQPYEEIKDLVEASIPTAVAFTQDAEFGMWKHTDEHMSHPLVMRVSKPKRPQKHVSRFTMEPGRIRGQLLAIRPYQLFELDTFMMNGVLYQRELVKVEIPYRQVLFVNKPDLITTGVQHFTELEAWMYLGVPDMWDQHMDGGFNYPKMPLRDPSKTNKKKVKPFYAYYDFKDNPK